MKRVTDKEKSQVLYRRIKQLEYSEDCIKVINATNTIPELEQLKTGYLVEHIQVVVDSCDNDGRDFEKDVVKEFCYAEKDELIKHIDNKIEYLKKGV